ncbi:MAG: GTPase Era [Gemmatimonadales bacterium]|nr:GTPase Era [Gemmatimonadales bacterium]
MSEATDTRFGTIALAGKPNSGKSTLFNAIVGAQLAITSRKPQSTREPVIGVYTEGTTQLVFIDPPGLLEPDYLLQETMLELAEDALAHADAILYLHPVVDGPAPPLETLTPERALPARAVATVLTFADALPEDNLPVVDPPTFLVAATTGRGLEELLVWCRSRAREGPFRYDPDDISTQPLRFFAAEFVREAAFNVLGEELPYSIATEVDEFRDGSEPVYIRVTIYVERESQKGMVIGRGGRTVRALGAQARERIEALVGQHVYLDLWVKVLPRWRRVSHALRQLGFPLPTMRKP